MSPVSTFKRGQAESVRGETLSPGSFAKYAKSCPQKMPRKKSTQLLPLPTVGDILRENFMKPLGFSAAEIGNAIPQQVYSRGPRLGQDFWAHQIRKLIGEESDDSDWEPDPDYRLLVALDRIFGRSDGYFLKLWAVCTAGAIARRDNRWLSKVSPIGREKCKQSFHALAGSCPDIEDILAAKPVAETLGRLEDDNDRRGNKETKHLLKSPRNSCRLKRAAQQLTTTHKLADWAKSQLSQKQIRPMSPRQLTTITKRLVNAKSDVEAEKLKDQIVAGFYGKSYRRIRKAKGHRP